MLDQLIQIVKQQAEEHIVQNKNIDNKYNDAAMQDTVNAIQGGLQEQLAKGNFKDVLDIFNTKTSNEGNPVIKQITEQLTRQFGNKYNLDGLQSSGIAGNLIQKVIAQLVGKTNDPSDNSIDLGSIIGSLTGKNTGNLDFGDLMEKLNGGTGKQDGFGLDDVAGMLKGEGAGGGLLGSLLGRK